MLNLFDNYIITSRIRLARNLSGLPFVIDDEATSNGIIQRAKAALKGERLKLYRIGELTEFQTELLKEKNLISRYLASNRKNGAAFISEEESFSIMVNEEDVIREQCFRPGFSLDRCYELLNAVDDKLNAALPFAYDNKLGYLTSCPTNVGTGMRASVMMFLPALTERNKMGETAKELAKKGMTVRGVHGEGSGSEGFMYQVSNEITLGVSEEEIIFAVEQAAEMLCIAEKQEERALYLKDSCETEDKCLRALALCENCKLLSYGEFIKMFAYIKLGVTLGFFGVTDVKNLDELTVLLRPANLCALAGENLDARGRDLFRAEQCAKLLKKTVKVNTEIR